MTPSRSIASRSHRNARIGAKPVPAMAKYVTFFACTSEGPMI
jgi:hypothetical protein